MAELFRRQAIDHQRQKFHGAIVLTRSPWRRVWTGFFAVVALALVAFASTFGFARKVLVSGVLQPSAGVLRVVAPQAGVVVHVNVAPGDQVQLGAPLLQLTTGQASEGGPTQQAVADLLAQRQRALDEESAQKSIQTRQRLNAIDSQLVILQTGIDQVDREYALQVERLRITQEIALRYLDLVPSGAAAQAEADEKAREVLEQQSRLVALERERVSQQRALAALQAERQILPLQAQREQSQQRREAMELSQQQAENDARRDSHLLARQGGQVGVVLVTKGQAVSAGQTLATLLPQDSELEAELDLPTRAAAFVHVGMPVWLRVDAFPYARWGQLPGTIKEVSRSALPTSDPTRLTASDSSFRLRVTIRNGVDVPLWRNQLQAGMQVQASIQAEQRTLLQWAFEPVARLKAAAL